MSIASYADWGDRANPEGIVGYSWDQGLIEKEMAVKEFAVRGPPSANSLALQITCDCWCRMPVVVLAVNVNDRRGRKIFGCNAFQAPQVNSINSIDVRRVANAKRPHAAVFAEIVLIALGVEQILGQL